MYYSVYLAISFIALASFAASVGSLDKFSVDWRTLYGIFDLSSRMSRIIVFVVVLDGSGFLLHCRT